jgi:hypothetical protein
LILTSSLNNGLFQENGDKTFENIVSELKSYRNKRPRRKQRGIVTLFLTFHAPQGAGNLPVILLNIDIYLE